MCPLPAVEISWTIRPPTAAVVQIPATRALQNEISSLVSDLRSSTPMRGSLTRQRPMASAAVALWPRYSQDSLAVDAGLKGITGDLFGALSTAAPAAAAKPSPAPPLTTVPANPRPTVPAKERPAVPAKPWPTVSAKPQPTPSTSKTAASQLARPAAPVRKLPAYYYRLPVRAQRCYLASDAIDRFPLRAGPAAFAMVTALMRALDGGAPSIVQRASQSLLDEICRLLGVRAVRIEVRSVRPRNSRGELHGLFYPRAPLRTAAATVRSRSATPVAGAPLIVLWMRTAQRHDVVKPRTFLRTLLHELGHYLDYALLKLDDSYHSGGFYQRESFLVRTLCPRDSLPPRSK
jgi:hypothetical protein